MESHGMSGTYTVQLDQRSRISFPAPFRSHTGELLFVSPDLDHLGHLVVRSEEVYNEQFEAIRSKLGNPDADPKRVRWEMRQFSGRTIQVSLDKNGRITLPSDLTLYAKLHDKVLVIGVGDYAEIWDAQTYLEAADEYESAFS